MVGLNAMDYRFAEPMCRECIYLAEVVIPSGFIGWPRSSESR